MKDIPQNKYSKSIFKMQYGGTYDEELPEARVEAEKNSNGDVTTDYDQDEFAYDYYIKSDDYKNKMLPRIQSWLDKFKPEIERRYKGNADLGFVYNNFMNMYNNPGDYIKNSKIDIADVFKADLSADDVTYDKQGEALEKDNSIDIGGSYKYGNQYFQMGPSFHDLTGSTIQDYAKNYYQQHQNNSIGEDFQDQWQNNSNILNPSIAGAQFTVDAIRTKGAQRSRNGQKNRYNKLGNKDVFDSYGEEPSTNIQVIYDPNSKESSARSQPYGLDPKIYIGGDREGLDNSGYQFSNGNTGSHEAAHVLNPAFSSGDRNTPPGLSFFHGPGPEYPDFYRKDSPYYGYNYSAVPGIMRGSLRARNPKNLHDADLAENYADLYGLRKELADLGIYDARKDRRFGLFDYIRAKIKLKNNRFLQNHGFFKTITAMNTVYKNGGIIKAQKGIGKVVQTILKGSGPESKVLMVEPFKIAADTKALQKSIFQETVKRAGSPVSGKIGKSPLGGTELLMAMMNGTYVEPPTHTYGGLQLNPNYYYRRGGGIIDDAKNIGKIRVPETGYIREAIKKYPGLDNGNPFSTTIMGQKFPYFSEGEFGPTGGKLGREPEDLIAIPKGLPWINGVAGGKGGTLKPYNKPSDFEGRATPLVNGETNDLPTEYSLLYKLNENGEYIPIEN